jgi:hypothetical protein
LRGRADTPLPAGERPAFEQVLAGARALLGQPAYSQQWAPGAGFTQDEAVAFALAQFGRGKQAGEEGSELRKF